MPQIPCLELNDGNSMPVLGIGTAGSDAKEKAYEATKMAIKAGYRHIDTAWIYETEKLVGRAIRECIEEGIVTREELFVTTKLWLSFFGENRARVGLRHSLVRLQLDYVDLFLVHWPCPLIPVEGEQSIA